MLTTINRCVFGILDGPLAEASIIFIIVGVLICVLLVVLRGVDNKGFVRYNLSVKCL